MPLPWQRKTKKQESKKIPEKLKNTDNQAVEAPKPRRGRPPKEQNQG